MAVVFLVLGIVQAAVLGMLGVSDVWEQRTASTHAHDIARNLAASVSATTTLCDEPGIDCEGEVAGLVAAYRRPGVDVCLAVLRGGEGVEAVVELAVSRRLLPDGTATERLQLEGVERPPAEVACEGTEARPAVPPTTQPPTSTTSTTTTTTTSMPTTTTTPGLTEQDVGLPPVPQECAFPFNLRLVIPGVTVQGASGNKITARISNSIVMNFVSSSEGYLRTNFRDATDEQIAQLMALMRGWWARHPCNPAN